MRVLTTQTRPGLFTVTALPRGFLGEEKPVMLRRGGTDEAEGREALSWVGRVTVA